MCRLIDAYFFHSYMTGETKMIEVSEELFEKLAENKEPSTWDQHLQRLYEMAHGIEDTKTPKLTDFTDGELGGELGTIQVPANGELELSFRLPDGTTSALVQTDTFAPGDEVTVEVPSGEIVDEE
jgi:hypothetical protein